VQQRIRASPKSKTSSCRFHTSARSGTYQGLSTMTSQREDTTVACRYCVRQQEHSMVLILGPAATNAQQAADTLYTELITFTTTTSCACKAKASHTLQCIVTESWKHRCFPPRSLPRVRKYSIFGEVRR
jgi:hypothetical protein